MKYTVPHSGHWFRTSIFLLLALLILVLAGPANARESGLFSFDAMGDVSGYDENRNTIKKKTTQLVSSWPPGMFLDISFFQAVNFKNGSGADCFPDGDYTGPFVVLQQRDGSARVDFYFVANGTDGSPDHKYVLQLFGTFDDPGNFPPALGSSIIMSAPAWLMSTEGRGQARKVTCTGDGDAGFAATVAVTRIN